MNSMGVVMERGLAAYWVRGVCGVRRVRRVVKAVRKKAFSYQRSVKFIEFLGFVGL